MSYILDALRKADAERDIGGVPSLHAQPFGIPEDEPGEAAKQPDARPVPWAWLGLGGLALAGLGLAAGAWLSSPPPPAAPLVAGSTPAAAQQAAAGRPDTPLAPAPDAGVAPAAPPSSSSPPADTKADSAGRPSSAQASTKAPDLPKAPRTELPKDPPADRPKAVPRQAPARVADAPPRPPAATRSAADTDGVAASPAAAAASARLPRLEELPLELKRGLPSLSVSGSVYSADPASRMLIVNGQLLREGDPLGGDAVLERIQAKSAVVKIRDQRALLTW